MDLYISVPEDGSAPTELDVYNFKGPGIALAMYNVDEVSFVRIFPSRFALHYLFLFVVRHPQMLIKYCGKSLCYLSVYSGFC